MQRGLPECLLGGMLHGSVLYQSQSALKGQIEAAPSDGKIQFTSLPTNLDGTAGRQLHRTKQHGILNRASLLSLRANALYNLCEFFSCSFWPAVSA